MKESKILKGVVTAVAVVAFSVPAIASAEEFKGRGVKVNYEDLNVQKEAGAQILYRRLQHASKQVCGVESLQNAGGAGAIAKQQQCYREALDAAVAKIDSAALAEIHNG